MTQHGPSLDATRSAGHARLAAFLPHAGSTYAGERNYDYGAGRHTAVSGLSPYLRARLITEEEVLAAVLAHTSAKSAEKFVQEVYWRTYFKGWLEQRPAIWTGYQAGLAQAMNRVHTSDGLQRAWEEACSGDTGIDCFDAWAQELAATGYLHNHTRMWFASIWIFTLRLPWELGADFFLRHLLDGDPASNTLSWRWVAGLHTRGKHYVARSGNIKRYTEGRFDPERLLNETPEPLDGPPHPDRSAIPADDPAPERGTAAFILHDEDMSPRFALPVRSKPIATAVLNTRAGLTPLKMAPQVIQFAQAALADCAAAHSAQLGPQTPVSTAAELAEWAANTGADVVVAPYAPVGPAARILADLHPLLAAQGQSLHLRQRAFDSAAWPHATAGFFKFKQQIPNLLAQFEPVS